MQSYNWYSTLIKPSWAPPAWLFGPVWTVLYAIIIASYGYVAYLFINKRIGLMVALPFLLNLIFNLAFTPIQFGLKNNNLAALDILLVLATLIWIFAQRSALREVGADWVIWANLPYLAWVIFATVLQLTVTYLNW